MIIPRDDVLGIDYPDPQVRDRAQVRLRKSALTEALQAGSVLFGGYQGGLLDRVTNVTVGDGPVVVETVPATLVEVFEDLDLKVEGAPIVFDATLDDKGARVVRSTRDWSWEPQEEPDGEPAAEEGVLRSGLTLAGMDCKGEAKALNIGLSGFQIELRYELVPVAEIRITKHWFSSTVERFDFYLRGIAAVKGTVGELSVAGGLTGKFECKKTIASIPFAFIPIIGPVGIAPVIKPELGIALNIGFTAGEVKIGGPVVDKGVELKAGFGYTSSEGFRTIADRQDVGEGVQWGQASAEMKNEFKIEVEPFAGAVLAKAITLAHWEILSAGTVGLKVFAGADLALALPFDPDDRAYRGPEWNIYAGVSADLAPLMETVESVNKFLDKIGIKEITNIDVTLFKYKRFLRQSPKPRLVASPSKVTIDESVTLRADAIDAGGMRAVFVGYLEDQDGPPRKILEETVPADGILKTTWTPKEGDDGKYQLNVRIYDRLFGSIGLPYAIRDEMPKVEVLVDTSLTIDPPGLEQGEVGREYAFTLTANRIPSEVKEVEFSWDFGDGTQETESASPSAGQAMVTIRHTYAEPGTYILTAFLNRRDTGEQIADARASVSVGSRLEIVPSFLSGELDVEYPFTFEATGMPSNASDVLISWNFGDGSTAAIGEKPVPVQNGRASTTVYHTFSAVGSYGVYGVARTAQGTMLANATAMVAIGEVPKNEYDLDICNTWRAAGSGGEAGTVDNWDISAIPRGAVFDLAFDAYSIPDMFIVEYPDGMVVTNTGWRGDPEYEGNPRYPGGIAGPGAGTMSGLFTKGKNDTFTVRVIGGEPGTAWDYSVMCR